MRFWACLLALLSCASIARAEPFELATLGDQSSLTPFLHWYRDDAGTAELADVRAAYDAGRFQRVEQRVPHFGFTTKAHWLTFSVVDRVGGTPWVLRLSYPQIDEVTLYRLLPNGTLQRVESGDMRPYPRRARASVEPTFEEHGTLAPTQYFLRAQTSGALRLPLSAWRPRALVALERRSELIALAFLGAIAVLALYNLGVYFLTKQLEHLVFAGVEGAELVALSSFGGLLSPLLQPAIANRALPCALAGTLLLGCLFALVVLGRSPVFASEARGIRRTLAPATALTAFTLFAPQAWAVRAAVVGLALVGIAGSYLLWRVRQARLPGIQLHERGWLCLAVALGAQLVATALSLPSSFLSEWGAHLGCLLQGLVLSLALAKQLNLVKERLAINVSELELALTRAEQATRVKDEFVATMSHELRTPLNAIINIPLALLEQFSAAPGAECAACGDQFALDPIEQLSASTPCPSCHATQLRPYAVTQFVGDPAQAKYFLALAERCGKHLLQMVNGVLDYSKITAGKFELQLAPTDPVRLLREACESMQEAATQKGVALRLELPVQTPQLATLDELRVRQVLFNLLSNAIKFSGAGTAVLVSADEREHELEIAVRDHGIGIAREHQERIFDGFEQVHRGDNRMYGGSGLGLSISRSLVRMHGGELQVESELGQGAIFRVRLPRDPTMARVANDNLAVVEAS
jgi:signal transduction histidine kinase